MTKPFRIIILASAALFLLAATACGSSKRCDCPSFSKAQQTISEDA